MTTRRFGDIALSGFLLALCLPLIAIAALAVWIDLGRAPVHRVACLGRDGRVVRLWRFRTAFATRYGPTPTLSGRLLRRWHIDRVPQLWNVLVGEISLFNDETSADAEKKLARS